jgi:hypothetical protein
MMRFCAGLNRVRDGHTLECVWTVRLRVRVPVWWRRRDTIIEDLIALAGPRVTENVALVDPITPTPTSSHIFWGGPEPR